MERVVIWGAGELGGRVAATWVADGGRAVGCTRSEARHPALRAAGVTPRTGAPLNVLRPDDGLVLALAGSAAQGDAIQALIDAGLEAPARAVLISSTGYYGATSHGPITVDSPAGPGTRAQRVAATEAAFRAWAGERGVILRCAGLYRPGRGPLSALRSRGSAPSGPPDKTLALVHYADAATATVAALRHPAPRPVYQVVSPPLPTRQQFYLAACVLLELPLPRFDSPLGMPPAQYDVAPLRADLLPAPAHPRWQEALVPQ
jgi:nucleoside-diphosphate-sugar epimerase